MLIFLLYKRNSVGVRNKRRRHFVSFQGAKSKAAAAVVPSCIFSSCELVFCSGERWAVMYYVCTAQRRGHTHVRSCPTRRLGSLPAPTLVSASSKWRKRRPTSSSSCDVCATLPAVTSQNPPLLVCRHATELSNASASGARNTTAALCCFLTL